MPAIKKHRRRFRVKKFAKRIWKGTKAALPVANKALDVALKLQRVINSEIHYKDQLISSNVNTSGFVTALHEMAQGDTTSTRTGSSIRPVRISGRYVLRYNSTETEDVLVRLYIIKAKQERGTAPTWANTFEAVQGANQQLFCPKLYNNRFNTKILWTRVVRLSPNNDSESTQKVVNFNIKLFGHIQYTRSANTAEDGGLYLFAQSTEATNAPNMLGQSRLTFYDN